MDNFWDKKIQVDLTLKELEDITLALRMVDKAFGGGNRSSLEERLTDITHKAKMSI